MKHYLAIAVLGLVSLTLYAQPNPKLAIYEDLVDKTLVATIPGSQMTDTQEFSWVFGGKFLRNYHYVSDVNGNKVYEGETIIAVDPKTDEVVWWYWTNAGGIITGTIEETEPGIYILLGENHTKDPKQPQKTKAVTENISPEGFRMTQYFWLNDEWVKRLTFDYKAQP